MEPDTERGHDPTPAESIAVCVRLTIKVYVRDEAVKTVNQEQANKEKDIGAEEPDVDFCTAEKIDKGHKDHDARGKA